MEPFSKWWELDIPILSSIVDRLSWIENVRIHDKDRRCLDVASLTMFWLI